MHGRSVGRVPEGTDQGHQLLLVFLALFFGAIRCGFLPGTLQETYLTGQAIQVFLLSLWRGHFDGLFYAFVMGLQVLMMILWVFLGRSETAFGIGGNELTMALMVFSFLMWWQRQDRDGLLRRVYIDSKAGIYGKLTVIFQISAVWHRLYRFYRERLIHFLGKRLLFLLQLGLPSQLTHFGIGPFCFYLHLEYGNLVILDLYSLLQGEQFHLQSGTLLLIQLPIQSKHDLLLYLFLQGLYIQSLGGIFILIEFKRRRGVSIPLWA